MADAIDKSVLSVLDGPQDTHKAKAAYGGFEGAAHFDRALARWQPALMSADGDVLPDKRTADARTRDVLRNDAFIQAGGEMHRDSIVGERFRLQAKPNYKRLGLDETWADEFQEEVESRWEAYAESEDCWADASGRLTFTGMVRMAVLTALAQGEVLAVAEWLLGSERPNRTALNLVDPDRLCNPFNVLTDDGAIRGGVERNRFGRPLAYHIHKGYPNESIISGIWEVVRVPARKPWGRRQVIHIVEPRRVDQSRGISQLVTALKETRVGRRFRDLVLQNAVLQATYAATIESELPSEILFQQLGGGDTPISDLATNYGAGFLQALAEYANSGNSLQIDGVRIPHLFPGTKLSLQNMQTPGGIGEDFEMSILRYTAAALGVSYEEFSRDYSKTNLSSIKAGMNQTRRTMATKKTQLADRFANQFYQLWFEEEFNNDRFETIPTRGAPDFYEGLNKQFYTRASWLGASQGQIDELKETQAAILRIKRGLSTYEIEAGRLGRDWRDLLKQVAAERKFMEALDIDFDDVEENAINAASGTANESSESDENTSEGGENNG